MISDFVSIFLNADQSLDKPVSGPISGDFSGSIPSPQLHKQYSASRVESRYRRYRCEKKDFVHGLAYAIFSLIYGSCCLIVA